MDQRPAAGGSGDGVAGDHLHRSRAHSFCLPSERVGAYQSRTINRRGVHLFATARRIWFGAGDTGRAPELTNALVMYFDFRGSGGGNDQKSQPCC